MGPVLDESRESLSILCDDRELICGQFIIHLSIPSSSLFSLCTVMRIMVGTRERIPASGNVVNWISGITVRHAIFKRR